MKVKPKGSFTEVASFTGDNIKIFALGGLGEIGKNMYCIECEDELIIIDCGVKFADNEYGVAYVIPDFTYLKNNQHKIKGMFITHGHEDHIGGIPYILKVLEIPVIYACGFAYALIIEKMKDYENISYNIEEYMSDSLYKYNNFTLSFFRINHSIPDSHGIAILTKMGYILHTGDFKIDFSPILTQTEYGKLTSYAERGVILLLSDSTNVLTDKISPSEKQIGVNIDTLFQSIKGRIIVATFASNAYRVKQIIEAAITNGRKIITFGRSMDKVIKVARSLEIIDANAEEFVSSDDMILLEKNKVVIIVTGSQGEELAALTRMARGEHKQVTIEEGDTIIFSSSAIPGNQDNINNSINLLFKQKANVIINNTYTNTHTTGHASSYEVKMMLALTKPKYFMPVHGEYQMQKEHIKLAVETGVNSDNCYLMDNGQVLTLRPSENRVFFNSEVKAGAISIDQSGIEIDELIRKERKILAEEGTIIVIYHLLDDQYLIDVDVFTKSFLKMRGYSLMLSQMKEKAIEIMNNEIIGKKFISNKEFVIQIRLEMEEIVKKFTSKKPMVVSWVARISNEEEVYIKNDII